MGIFSDAVDSYREKGWNLVPITALRQKAPVVPGYTGKSGIMADDATIERWKDEYADNNFGIRLDHGWVGIDVDDYNGKNGQANLEQFAVDHKLPALPPTYSTSSRTGYSGIFMFRYQPILMEGRAFLTELGGGVEVIQFNHRYAVAPPSIHPDTHLPYQWRGYDREPGVEIPHRNDVTTLALPWLMGISVKASGPAGATMTASTLPSKVECEAWLADQRGDGMPWEGLLRSITDRIEGKALEGTRYAAMRWATAMVVGDVAGAKLPGLAVYELERLCRLLYEAPPGHKVAKTFAGTKQRDFWNLVAGAMLHYEDGGEWRERIEDDIESGLFTEALRALPMDDVEVDPVEPEETSVVVPDSATAPGDIVLPFHALDPIEPDEVMAADGAGLVVADDGAEIVAGAEAFTRAAATIADAVASMDPDRRAMFTQIVREHIEAYRAAQGGLHIVKGELTTAGLSEAFVRDQMPEITIEKVEAWSYEAAARIRSRESLTNIFDPVIDPHWIEGHWLPKGALATFVASPSVGKTLALIDLACRLAIGALWQGEFTEQTSVLYLAFEAPKSVHKRIAAWSQWPAHHELLDDCRDPDLVQWRGVLPTPRRLWVASMAGVDLTTEGGVRQITNYMQYIGEVSGQFPGVVIIDTLAQAMGGGEENDTGVMGAFTSRMREILNSEGHADTTVSIAHHPVKGTKPHEHGTSRGSGALLAAMDIEVSLRKIPVEGAEDTYTDLIEMRRQKARDGEYGVKLLGLKKIVRLVGVDGSPMIDPRTGEQTVAPVWTEPTPEDMAATGSDTLAVMEMAKAIAKAEMERHVDELLAGLGWVKGDDAPKTKFSATALKDLWGGKTLDSKTATALAGEVIAEAKAQIHDAYLVAQAEAEGVD